MHVEIQTSNTSDKSIRGVCGMYLFNAIYDFDKAANDSKTSVRQDLQETSTDLRLASLVAEQVIVLSALNV